MIGESPQGTYDFIRMIIREGMFMVDSGGQYLDGTTDVTRTFHYGTPTEEMVDRYTDVLQVNYFLVTTNFVPDNTKTHKGCNRAGQG